MQSSSRKLVAGLLRSGARCNVGNSATSETKFSRASIHYSSLISFGRGFFTSLQQQGTGIATATAAAAARGAAIHQPLCLEATAAAAARRFALQQQSGHHLPRLQQQKPISPSCHRFSSTSTSGAATGGKVVPTGGAAAAAGGGAAAAGGGGGSSLRERLTRLMGGPSQLARSASRRVSDASSTMYKHMPSPAKQWVDASGKPDSMRRVVSLQLEAFWQRHSRGILLLGGLFAAYMLWRTLFGMAKFFINLSDTVAASGFLALAASMVLLGYSYTVRRYTINPATVYNMALARLNTNPAVLEVMGAPVAGSELRASILTGGGVRVKNLRPRLRSRRLQMIFPLAGSDRRGLVSLEAKKRKGKVQFKLLAVDVPSASGPAQRLFLEGGEELYERGGVLNELRQPFLRALGLRDLHEAEDEADEEREEEEEEQQAAIKAADRAKTAPKPLDDGGGMYFHERAYLAVKRLLLRAADLARSGATALQRRRKDKEAKEEAAARAAAVVDGGGKGAVQTRKG